MTEEELLVSFYTDTFPYVPHDVLSRYVHRYAPDGVIQPELETYLEIYETAWLAGHEAGYCAGYADCNSGE